MMESAPLGLGLALLGWFFWMLATFCVQIVPVYMGEHPPGLENYAPIRSVVIFGDSTVDTGNDLGGSHQPLFWKGRYSNGPIYVDYLKRRLSANTTIHNFAHGGATTSDQLAMKQPDYTRPGPPAPSVQVQIATYLHNLFSESTLDPPSFSTLFILHSGHNDYMEWWNRHLANHSDFEPTTHDLQECVEAVTTAVLDNVNTLLRDHWPAYGHQLFLVADLPPMQAFPFARTYYSKHLDAFEHMTILHNQVLDQKLQTLKLEAPIFQLGVYDLMTRLLHHPTQYGFAAAAVDQPCCPNPGEICTNPQERIFWDEFHLSTRVHSLLSQEAWNVLGLGDDCPNVIEITGTLEYTFVFADREPTQVEMASVLEAVLAHLGHLVRKAHGDSVVVDHLSGKMVSTHFDFGPPPTFALTFQAIIPFSQCAPPLDEVNPLLDWSDHDINKHLTEYIFPMEPRGQHIFTLAATVQFVEGSASYHGEAPSPMTAGRPDWALTTQQLL